MKKEPPREEGETERQYDARMPRYSSAYPAQFAIELQSGMLDRLDLKIEDKIPIELDRLRGMAK